MEPSSLVFVAIIGVWAAYLVPHWLRTRDELAQSRTRDRFSGGLRVLQRRPRPVKTSHRSGDAVLTSPRVVVDADGEFLYIPADRALAARLEAAREAAAAEAIALANAEDAASDLETPEPDGVVANTEIVPDDVAAAVRHAAASGAGAVLDLSEVDPVPASPEPPSSSDEKPFIELLAPVERRATAEAPASMTDDAPPAPTEAVAWPTEAVASPDEAAASHEATAPQTAAATGTAAGIAAPTSPKTGSRDPFTARVPGRAPAAIRQPAPAAERTLPAERPAARSTSQPHDPRAHDVQGGDVQGEDVQGDDVPTDGSPVPAEVAERPYDLDLARAGARIAARRRAAIMAVLFVAAASGWAVVSVTAVSAWVAVPASVLLVLHALASRVAGLRSRETLTLLAAQLHAAELALARPQRQRAVTARVAEVAAEVAQTPLPDRVARRAAAVGAETWEPVPVPPPTYTLKPAVHRPEPAPLDLPAAQPAAAVSRGALPRRAADVERILALESDVDQLFEHPKAVNG